MTSGRHCPISKVIDSINKNLFLLDGKALVPEGVGFLLCLGKASNASRNSRTRAFILLSCIAVICTLSSLNCSNCGVNSFRFKEFIAHFVVVVKRVLTCFGAGRALVRDIGYLCYPYQLPRDLRVHSWWHLGLT